MADPEQTAIKLLVKQRKTVAHRIAQTDDGRELERLDGALRALGVDPLDPAPPARRTSTADSVRSKVQRLLEEIPGRSWTYDQIIEAYEVRGDPIGGKEPKAALRTALWAMQKDGVAVKLDSGTFGLSAERIAALDDGGGP